MSRTVQVCTSGECDGECYRCRMKMVIAERDRFARAWLRAMDAGIVSGTFGPWSDHWTDEDRKLWDEAEELKARFA